MEHRSNENLQRHQKDTLIVADGFSCKHQIMEGSDRRALHLAQVLQMALHESPNGPPAGYPETHYPDVRQDGPARQKALARTAVVVGVGAAALAGVVYAASKLKSKK